MNNFHHNITQNSLLTITDAKAYSLISVF